jgi:hypothetical protein
MLQAPVNVYDNGRYRSLKASREDRDKVLIQSVEDVDLYISRIRKAAADAQAWMTSQAGDPLDFLRRIKFEMVGFHPVDGRALNVVEQINQTWTYVVALAATRHLLDLHPDAGGYRLAPGATASLPLDIMSQADGLVGAETFAAVDPRNNTKLAKDLTKMAARPERNRDICVMSPRFPGIKRLTQFERDGVQVWSVDLQKVSHS